ncbi:MAG: methyltransferase domain-containing protein [Prosthecochloris sp.]|uniref:Methyltransferase type 11 n=1 Tax=Prosthecochloris aestuarii (strain DSM 271 / SK 413) TaxID=290512 RepID=B4S7E4_PROA2|nr:MULTISPECIES: class I SAM-dependent methyltransferase [Prosthecochloris]ACF45981.1 Methyltransferase type 11 [Prosthecochloris aestuarii DSM 271]MCW8798714.1 methyltransferase domain-containing protein [Prosthecochloris sp.]NEX12508.1 class I SAM-dependent methyltransferase [Prosthecochloris sp.]
MNNNWNSNSRFDKAAESWDESPRRTALAMNVFAALQRMVPFQKRWNIMEAGCGTGLLTLPAARLVKSVLGVDPSPGMLDILNKKAAAEKFQNITTRVSDLLSISKNHCPEAPFDCLFSSMTLHHIKDAAAAVRIMASLLAPGGFLAIADLDEEDGFFHDNEEEEVHHGFSRTAVEEMLIAAGCSNIRFDTATAVTKTNRAGKEKTYTIFLAVAEAPNC